MSTRSPKDFEPGESIPVNEVLEFMQPAHRRDVLCDLVRKGEPHLVHWAMVTAANDAERFVHAAVLREAARSDDPALAIEAVRSQSTLENDRFRLDVLGAALGSKDADVALEAVEQIAELDLRHIPEACQTLKSAFWNGHHEGVEHLILNLAGELGTAGREFQVVCVAGDRGSADSVRLRARQRMHELKRLDPTLNEYSVSRF